MIKATVLHPGRAEGPVLRLDAPLSLWGGFAPATGKIIDTHHPQVGLILTGRIVLMEESRGSGTSPGAIAEAIRLQTAPLAIVLVRPDINLAIGAMVASGLYGSDCAILTVAAGDFVKLAGEPALAIALDGTITPPRPTAHR
jgi:predicted aconitase with swiveling domain